jgi:hypothetical protein
MAKIMNMADAMISFSYRDPCPKTVSQGISCGLPILFSNSGGHPEQIKNGVAIPDNQNIQIEIEDTSVLCMKDIEESFHKFKQDFTELSSNAWKNAITYDPYNEMIKSYFNVFRDILKTK